MTNGKLIEILRRYTSGIPVKVADADGLYDATAFDVQVVEAPDAVGGLALCISAHDSSKARQVLPEVVCPSCGWVHVAIPRHHAEQHVSDANADHLASGNQPVATMDAYLKCFRCGKETSAFLPAQPSDAPLGCTLQPAVVEPRQPRQRLPSEVFDGLAQS